MTSAKRKPAAGARGGSSEYKLRIQSDRYQENSKNANLKADVEAFARTAKMDARKRGIFKIGNAVIAEMPKRSRGKAPVWVLRLREIEKLIKNRHGGLIPEPEGCDDEDLCFAYLRAAAGSGSPQDLNAWAARWAPWASDADIAAISQEFAERDYMLSADQVGKLLFVRNVERTVLDLRTVGACDLTKGQRSKLARERKRERDRKAKNARRRKAGTPTREEWLQRSVEAQKPWEAAGVSRRKWFYDKAKCTGSARIDIKEKRSDDTPVQTAEDQSPETVTATLARRA